MATQSYLQFELSTSLPLSHRLKRLYARDLPQRDEPPSIIRKHDENLIPHDSDRKYPRYIQLIAVRQKNAERHERTTIHQFVDVIGSHRKS